jgi:hypothetical protein
MRKAIKRENIIKIRVELGIQSYRNLAIKISRRYMRKKKVFRPDEDDENGDRNKNTKYEITAEQAEHTSHVKSMIYARSIMERDKKITSKR